jgi:thymidine kinase
MANHKVVVCCWEHGHRTELFMTVKQEDKLVKKIGKLKAVCPTRS